MNLAPQKQSETLTVRAKIAVKDELASILSMKTISKPPTSSEIKPLSPPKNNNPFKKPFDQLKSDVTINDQSDEEEEMTLGQLIKNLKYEEVAARPPEKEAKTSEVDTLFRKRDSKQ